MDLHNYYEYIDSAGNATRLGQLGDSGTYCEQTCTVPRSGADDGWLTDRNCCWLPYGSESRSASPEYASCGDEFIAYLFTTFGPE